MESYEVLRRAMETGGAKQVAKDLRVSVSLAYKWTQQPPSSSADEGSGARNPLDRVLALLVCTGDDRILGWLCERRGGFFVLNPRVPPDRADADYIARTQRIVQDFSDLLGAVSDAITDDGKVDQAEARRIRTEWERLKQYGEGFVRACEEGLFDRDRRR